MSVIYLHSIIRTVERSQTAQAAPLFLKLARSLPSQTHAAGHMETLNRSSSTDFLLLIHSEHSQFHSLNIKTYGSHHPPDRKQREEEMGGSGQNIINCILTAHKVRRQRADDKVGGCYPDGEENNEENESLCPSIFTWVRREMKIPFS